MSLPNYRLMADISSNNQSFNAAQYASAGHVAVAVKATEYSDYTNPRYVEWTTAAHEHGLAVIHYHFARPENGNPLAETQHFWETVKPHFRRPGDYVVMDVETGSYEQARSWTMAADLELRRISSTHPWIYAPYAYYDGADLRAAARCYWVAAWGDREPKARRGDTFTAWQRTDGVTGPAPHSLAGVGRCDVSVINRTFAKQLKRDYDRRRHPAK